MFTLAERGGSGIVDGIELAVSVDAIEGRLGWVEAMLDIMCIAQAETDLLDGKTLALGLTGTAFLLRGARRDLRAEVDRGLARPACGKETRA